MGEFSRFLLGSIGLYGYVIYTVYIYNIYIHIFMDPDTSHVSVVPLNAPALACSVVMIAEEGSN
jgi:uncharacterized protein with PQ loop repeat